MLYDISVDVYYVDSLLIFLLSESANLFFCSIILFLLYYFKKLNQQELIFWLLGFSSIIVLAPFIQTLFPDSGGYLRCVRDFRDNFIFDELGCQAHVSPQSESFQFLNFKRSATAIYYTAIPIPSIATIVSLGFINKLYILAMYFFLRRRLNNDNTKFYLLVLLFFPTLLIYSATGLRDIFVLVVQSLLFFTIIDRKLIISTVFLVLLAAIKAQNAAVLSVLYFGIFVFGADKSFKRLALFFPAFLIIIFYYEGIILGVINYFKLGFLNEMGMIPPGGLLTEYESIASLIFNSPILFIKGLFSPGVGLGALSIIFFPESLVFIGLFYIGIKSSNYFSEPIDYLVFFIFYVGVVLYFIVVENDSTFLRYRFTFIYLFLFHLLLAYDQRTISKATKS